MKRLTIHLYDAPMLKGAPQNTVRYFIKSDDEVRVLLNRHHGNVSSHFVSNTKRCFLPNPKIHAFN